MKLICYYVVFWGDEGDFGVMGWAWEKGSKKDNTTTIENVPARERRLAREYPLAGNYQVGARLLVSILLRFIVCNLLRGESSLGQPPPPLLLLLLILLLLLLLLLTLQCDINGFLVN